MTDVNWLDELGLEVAHQSSSDDADWTSELEAPKGYQGEALDPSQGGTYAQRTAFSVLQSDEAKRQFLERQYGGPFNVQKLDNGVWVVNDGTQWKQFDEANITGRDIADLAGPAIEGTLAAVGGIGASPIIGGAAGQMAGRAINQGLADYALGGGPEGVGERALNLGAAGLEGFAGGVAGKAIQGAVNLAKPGYRYAQQALSEIYEPVARKTGGVIDDARQWLRGAPGPLPKMKSVAGQGAKLEREVGTGMNLAQQTQSETLARAEAIARRGDMAADIMSAADFKQQQAFTSSIDEFLDNISKGQPKSGAGEMLATTYENHLNGLINKRRMIGDKAYSDAFRLIGSKLTRKESKEVFLTKSTRRAATILRNELNAPAGPQAIAGGDGGLASRLTTYLDNLPDAISPKEIKTSMSLWRKELEGTGDITKDLPPSQRKRVATTILTALRRDFEKAEELGRIPKGSVDALNAVDRVYAELSAPIDETKELAIAKVIGADAAPEKIVERFRSMVPTQIKEVMTFVEKANPEVAQSVRRSVIEDVLAKSQEKLIGGSRAYRPSAIAVLDNNPDVTAKLAALLPKSDHGALMKLIEIARRTRNKPLAGSPTGPYIQARAGLEEEMAGMFGKGPVAGGVMGAVGSLATGGAVNPATVALAAAGGKGISVARDWFVRRNIRELATIISDPNGMQLLRELAKPGVNVQKATRITHSLGRIAHSGFGEDYPNQSTMTEDKEE